MALRLDERIEQPAFSPSGDARAPYETHGTTFLQYLARRAAKTRALLPLAQLLRERRAGGPEYPGALACFAYYVAAASTTYGVGYRQPDFTDERMSEESDRETDATITAINTGASREIAARLHVTLPKIGRYESSERVLGTTVGLRGLGCRSTTARSPRSSRRR